MANKKKGATAGSTYETGYGKPPINTRWAKGTSGNPAGKPKGALSFRKIFVETVSKEMVISENGAPFKVTCAEALLRKVQVSAFNGDQKAIGLMMSLMEKYLSDPDIEDLGSPPDQEIIQDFLDRKIRNSGATPPDAENPENSEVLPDLESNV